VITFRSGGLFGKDHRGSRRRPAHSAPCGSLVRIRYDPRGGAWALVRCATP
jgi:hypothetical protein